MSSDGALREAVDRFVADVVPAMEAVAELADRPSDRMDHDVTVEAFNATLAVIASDGRQTDDELWGLAAAFGARLDTQLGGATPEQMRAAGVSRGKEQWLEDRPVMFDILLEGDRRRGTTHSRTYYDRMMDVAHTVASLDRFTSTAELEAIDRLRSTLVAGLNSLENQVAAAGGAEKTGPTGSEDIEEPSDENLDDVLAELNELIGLETVKHEVRLLTDLVHVQQLRASRGLPTLAITLHVVFSGNPGTGKTTVGRLLSRVYRSLDVVAKGHLIETDRSGLVAGYVGQTAARVREVFDQADGGVLLIDEAYALARGGEKDFGREAIDTLVKLIEDRRDRVIVIAAGYPDEMRTFLDSNPGLRSRFPRTVQFPDYDNDELLGIFELIGRKNHYHLDDRGRNAVLAWFDARPRGKGFGNGRLSRNLFDAAVARHASRVVGLDDPTDHDLSALTEADIPTPDEELHPEHRSIAGPE
ncbi:MAG: AAA family ATPase [Actinomycetia bacterium]|nr:AAA family ATPase [Actinomycetes bacterium]MCP4087971.1 AAA family ATPase [Actinomycetes bacterium]